MRESQFLCLAVSRREGGNCIAGIDTDTGAWIRPVNAKTHGAFGDYDIFVLDSASQKCRFLAPLDLVQIRLDRHVGNNIQPENWEMAPASIEKPYVVLRRFDGPREIETLISYSDRNGPLLHSLSNRIQADDLFVSKLSRSLSIVQPEQLIWKVGPHPIYAGKLRVEAEFGFDGDPYCLVVTDPMWESICKRLGTGRHSHSKVAPDSKGRVFLTISLAEVPLHGYHYKLVAGVLNLPS